ncbi:MAG: hypothetical protein RLY78_670 [Pseudomonadota bacterium]|jgi:c-di-GMP-binding flagellar brake protein YcgR|uniref:Flagellar regulator YcgR PilZN domain-containing protein n=1 Tax=Pseudaquabacterium rugosum TaxID=2984194 RepID=A0ABU9B815_9BURK
MSTADDPLDARAAFRCDDPQQIRDWLGALHREAAALALCGPQGAPLPATLWALDDERGRLHLDVEVTDPGLDALIDADEVTVVGHLQAVRLQFDLRGLLLVHRPRAVSLQAAVPRSVYRFPRRAWRRLEAPAGATAMARLRHPGWPEMQLALRIVDIGLGGCALLLPDDVPPLPLGIRVHGVRIALDEMTGFDAALQLQHVTAVGGEAPARRLGCAWVDLGDDDRRRLQHWIERGQRRWPRPPDLRPACS